MRILDRYILKPVIFAFIGCLFVFVFLYIFSDILSHLDEILKNHISFNTLYLYYLAYLPLIFTQTSPIAILLATIYTFSKLNRDNELIAMRASGLSLWQLTSPIILMGILLSLVVLLTSERILPRAQEQANKLKTQIEGVQEKVSQQVIHNLTFYGLNNRLFFVNSFDPKADTMEGISILEHDQEQNLTSKVVARKGVFKERYWVFYEYTCYNFNSYGQIAGEAIYSEEKIMNITETPQDFLQQRTRPEFMNISQLENYIWRLKKSGATAALRSLSVDLYQRYACAFTSLVLILIGIPFSFMIRRRANIFSSFGICIIISFLYYLLNAVCLSLGKNGILLPVVAAWITPAGFSSLAIRSMFRLT